MDGAVSRIESRTAVQTRFRRLTIFGEPALTMFGACTPTGRQVNLGEQQPKSIKGNPTLHHVGMLGITSDNIAWRPAANHGPIIRTIQATSHACELSAHYKMSAILSSDLAILSTPYRVIFHRGRDNYLLKPKPEQTGSTPVVDREDILIHKNNGAMRRQSPPTCSH